MSDNLGHNNPPSPIEAIRATIEENHAQLLANTQKVLEGADRAPELCDDDETAGKLGDLIKLISGVKKNVEAARVAEKEPYLAGGRGVDAVFKVFIDKLDAATNKTKKPLDSFLKKKAEAKRLEDERIREEQRKEAERLRKEAEEKAAEAAKQAAEGKTGQADQTMLDAIKTQNQANATEAAANVVKAPQASNRGYDGSLATLRRVWVGEVIDINAIDLETLRPFFNPDDVQKALNGFVRAGHRELRGAAIYEKETTTVR